MTANVIRIDNEVIRFLAHIEASERDRHSLEALIADAEGVGEVRAFAHQLGFVFSLDALVDAIEQLRATVPDDAEAQRRTCRSANEVFRLGSSIVRLRTARRPAAPAASMKIPCGRS